MIDSNHNGDIKILFDIYIGWVLITTLIILVCVSIFNTILLIWIKVSQNQSHGLQKSGDSERPPEIVVDTAHRSSESRSLPHRSSESRSLPHPENKSIYTELRHFPLYSAVKKTTCSPHCASVPDIQV